MNNLPFDYKILIQMPNNIIIEITITFVFGGSPNGITGSAQTSDDSAL